MMKYRIYGKIITHESNLSSNLTYEGKNVLVHISKTLVYSVVNTGLHLTLTPLCTLAQQERGRSINLTLILYKELNLNLT